MSRLQLCLLMLAIPISSTYAVDFKKGLGVYYIHGQPDGSATNVSNMPTATDSGGTADVTDTSVDNVNEKKVSSDPQTKKERKLKKTSSSIENTESNSSGKTSGLQSVKKGLRKLIAPQSNENYRKVQLNELSNFNYNGDFAKELPSITPRTKTAVRSKASSLKNVVRPYQTAQLSFFDAISQAVQRHPSITQSIASLASQNASIDVAKAGYYPQISGGVRTGSLTNSNTTTTAGRGQQLYSIDATQMIYDFGKVKSSVNVQEAKLLAAQANVLVNVDDIAVQVASSIVNIKRYQEICRIAQEQIDGIGRISEIANLRAKAGISSQADPVQAQSYLEAARSNLIAQQTQLRVYQERLRTLLGMDVVNNSWEIPESLVQSSEIYSDPEFNKIPRMMEAKAQVDVASYQKKQVQLSKYPTLNLTGSLSQAINGINQNNSKDDGFYSSVMLQATSNFYQGGATAAQTKAASYAEEAAKSQVNSVYLDVLNQIRATRENVENKQRQMQVLIAQQATTVRTKELYQEQYKLGTRTVVDLLNAEQAIHSANQQIESIRYDIYDNLVQYIAATGKTRDVYKLNNLSIQGVEIQP